MKQSRIIKLYAETKIRLNEGINTVSFIKNSIYVGAGLTIIFKLSVWWSVISTILALIGFYMVGWVSYKLRLPQEIAKLGTGKYNPYFIKKLGKIERFK